MNNSKIKDAIALLKAKAYIYVDGKRASFWGDLKDEEILGTWHTLMRIKHDLDKHINAFEAKYFPAKEKKSVRKVKK